MKALICHFGVAWETKSRCLSIKCTVGLLEGTRFNSGEKAAVYDSSRHWFRFSDSEETEQTVLH